MKILFRNILGISIICFGLLVLFNSVLGGIFFISAGIWMFHRTYELIPEKYRMKISRSTYLFVFAILIVLGFFISIKSSSERESKNDETYKQVDILLSQGKLEEAYEKAKEILSNNSSHKKSKEFTESYEKYNSEDFFNNLLVSLSDNQINEISNNQYSQPLVSNEFLNKLILEKIKKNLPLRKSLILKQKILLEKKETVLNETDSVLFSELKKEINTGLKLFTLDEIRNKKNSIYTLALNYPKNIEVKSSLEQIEKIISSRENALKKFKLYNTCKNPNQNSNISEVLKKYNCGVDFACDCMHDNSNEFKAKWGFVYGEVIAICADGSFRAIDEQLESGRKGHASRKEASTTIYEFKNEAELSSFKIYNHFIRCELR